MDKGEQITSAVDTFVAHNDLGGSDLDRVQAQMLDEISEAQRNGEVAHELAVEQAERILDYVDQVRENERQRHGLGED